MTARQNKNWIVQRKHHHISQNIVTKNRFTIGRVEFNTTVCVDSPVFSLYE